MALAAFSKSCALRMDARGRKPLLAPLFWTGAFAFGVVEVISVEGWKVPLSFEMVRVFRISDGGCISL